MQSLHSSSPTRLSTNELLENIINAPNDGDCSDEEMVPTHSLEAYERIKKAKNHIGRAYLYGGGARAKLPRVKRKKDDIHPFTVLKYYASPEKPTTHSDSIPPGAHSDLYRRVCNLTRKSLNDPESYQYTTTSMTDGVPYAPGQPPWYCGYNNKTVPPDSPLIHAASRYGFRGCKGISQREAKGYQSPKHTRTEHTPSFLDVSIRLDEWVPPILARSFQSVNGMESPKLWPENTEYPSGARLKKAPTSMRYNRETTVANSPTGGVLTGRADAEHIDADKAILDFARMESRGTYLSAPMTARLTFDTMWASRVKSGASKPLSISMSIISGKRNPQGLTDSTDRISYSGKSAFIVHSPNADANKHRLSLETGKIWQTYESQWNHSIVAFRVIKGQVKRESTMTLAISELSNSLLCQAVASGSVGHSKRNDFLSSFRRCSACSTLTSQQVSLLFNSFDPLRRGSVPIVDIIAAFTILDNPLEPTAQKLSRVWHLHDQYRCAGGLSKLDTALSTLRSCCNSEGSRGAVEKDFKLHFRPTCYSLSLRESQSPSRLSNNFKSGNDYTRNSNLLDLQMMSSKGMDLGQYRPMTSLGSHHTNHSLTGQLRSRASTAYSSMEGPGRRTGDASFWRSRGVASVHPYSISEPYLGSFDSFIVILTKCPSALHLFETQLSDRLAQCYGRDDRLPPEKTSDDKVVVEDTDKDFSWILKIKPQSKLV